MNRMDNSRDSGAVITVVGTSQGTTETTVRAGEFQFIIDEPESFGGQNKAPSPVAYLLGAIAGCVVAIGNQAARELGIKLTRLDAEVEGRINSDAFFGRSFDERPGFSEIVIRLEVDCDADPDPDQFSHWKKQVLERCPVIDNLVAATRVVVQ